MRSCVLTLRVHPMMQMAENSNDLRRPDSHTGPGPRYSDWLAGFHSSLAGSEQGSREQVCALLSSLEWLHRSRPEPEWPCENALLFLPGARLRQRHREGLPEIE